MKYHDRLNFREKIAKLFYRLPYVCIFTEKILVIKIIPFVEGENPHYVHLGRECPCMRE